MPHSQNGGTEVSLLAFQRSQLEQGIDVVIVERLREGMLLRHSSEQIKSHINQGIISYLQSIQVQEPLQLQIGFAKLQTTNYLSLTNATLQALTLQELNANSHVFVLPINQQQQYGEYTYTGGMFGTNILTMQIESPNGETIAALPSGYRECAIDAVGEVPCTSGAT